MQQNKKKTKKRKTTRKPKVYIPTYKIIILCSVVIVICISLLLATTVKSTPKKQDSSITKRYEQTQEKQQDKNQNSAQKKEENSSKKQIQDNKTQKNQTQTSSSKNNQNKDTQSKTSQVQKKEQNPPTKNKNETPQKKEATSPKKQNSSTPKTDSSQNQSQKNQIPQKNETKNSSAKSAKSEQTAKSEQNKKQGETEKKESQPSSKNENRANANTSKPANTTKQETSVPSKEKSSFNFPQAKNGAQLIFVFDDGGQNLSHLKPFLQLPIPITIAVLPKLAHSAESAEQIRKSGKEVILHQPMQAVNPNVNPGPGAITPQMTEDQIIATVFNNLHEIGPVAGMNNHEGSQITADAQKMETILKTASSEGIYFLDSRTNKDTKVPYVAQQLGYSYYERNIFLDNEKTNENALAELKKGLDIANKNGSVIMIGHIWSADFLPKFILDVLPELKEKGYTFSTVSKSKAKKN